MYNCYSQSGPPPDLSVTLTGRRVGSDRSSTALSMVDDEDLRRFIPRSALPSRVLGGVSAAHQSVSMAPLFGGVQQFTTAAYAARANAAMAAHRGLFAAATLAATACVSVSDDASSVLGGSSTVSCSSGSGDGYSILRGSCAVPLRSGSREGSGDAYSVPRGPCTVPLRAGSHGVEGLSFLRGSCATSAGPACPVPRGLGTVTLRAYSHSVEAYSAPRESSDVSAPPPYVGSGSVLLGMPRTSRSFAAPLFCAGAAALGGGPAHAAFVGHHGPFVSQGGARGVTSSAAGSTAGTALCQTRSR